MLLAVRPPVAPMLARLVRQIPRDGLWYEPKWDGFRCLAFRDGAEVDLRSRHDRPLARYFPEACAALAAVATPAFVLDGELLATRDGRYDFAALLGRLHPSASRVARLRLETPVEYVVFDLLAEGAADLRRTPLGSRRKRLVALLAGAPDGVTVTPSTDDPEAAERWLDAGPDVPFDGVVGKPVDSPYLPGRRGWWKIKRERTTDCVVAGFRPYLGEPMVSSLLLGLYDADGALRHVGVVSAFSNATRTRLLPVLLPYVTDLAGHPWEHGFALEGGALGRLAGSAGRWAPDMTMDWVPLRPALVCEVAHERPDGLRFRHPARFRRWRPDRSARSCTVDQLVDTGAPRDGGRAR